MTRSFTGQDAALHPYSYRGLRAWDLVLLMGILSIGLLLRTRHFSDELSAHHAYRQAHVAANIHFLVASGFSLTPEQFDQSLSKKLYDGPLYQNLVAAVCRMTDLSVIAGARSVNLLIYALTCATLLGIMRETGITIRAALMALLFFTLSPVGVYYDRAVIPDTIAILLSLLSLLSYLQWIRREPSSDRSRLLWWWMVLFGAASAFIKSPVMFTIVLLVLGHWVTRNSLLTLFRSTIAAYALACATVVLLFTA